MVKRLHGFPRPVVLAASLLLGLLLLSGCSRYTGANTTLTLLDSDVATTSSVPVFPEEMPSDFGFVAHWGVGAKNSIDTFADTVTKDRVSEEPVTAELKLSRESLLSLYRDLWAIEGAWQVFSTGFTLDPNPETGATFFVTPYMTYRLNWRARGWESAGVNWEDKHLSQDPKAVALREWFQKLREIVEATPEWQALPPAVGAYL